MPQIQSAPIILASASRNSAGQTSAFKVKFANSLRFFINATVHAGGGNLQAFVEGSPDNSTWYILATFDPIGAVLTAATSDIFTQAISAPPLYVRIRWTLSVAVTFSITMTRVSPI